MVKVKINNKQNEIEISSVIYDLFQKLGQEAARLEGYNKGEISVAFLIDEEIKAINKKYKDTDRPTDVLSFPLGDEILGDILISVERARAQAEEYGHSFKREMCYLFVHGVLHLFGYNHKNSVDKKQMRQKEERVLSKFDLNRSEEFD